MESIIRRLLSFIPEGHTTSILYQRVDRTRRSAMLLSVRHLQYNEWMATDTNYTFAGTQHSSDAKITYLRNTSHGQDLLLIHSFDDQPAIVSDIRYHREFNNGRGIIPTIDSTSHLDPTPFIVKMWCFCGKRHRIGAPAVTMGGIISEHWVNGVRIPNQN